MILTDDDLKGLQNLTRDIEELDFTEEDKRTFAELEKELSCMDLDFLLR